MNFIDYQGFDENSGYRSLWIKFPSCLEGIAYTGDATKSRNGD